MLKSETEESLPKRCGYPGGVDTHEVDVQTEEDILGREETSLLNALQMRKETERSQEGYRRKIGVQMKLYQEMIGH